jgi:hypothetical protein
VLVGGLGGERGERHGGGEGDVVGGGAAINGDGSKLGSVTVSS